jgi:hypothetical protein
MQFCGELLTREMELGNIFTINILFIGLFSLRKFSCSILRSRKQLLALEHLGLALFLSIETVVVKQTWASRVPEQANV